MNSILNELKAWSVSATEVVFNDELRAKLGEYAQLGDENSRYMQAFVLRYKLNSSLISGFVIIPKALHPGPLPVIIFNRGGTKDYGLVKRGTLFTRLGWLARAGYIVVGSQYPDNSLSEGIDEWGGGDLESVLGLYSLIQQLSVADEKRVGMLGTSRGGMMTYLAMTKVSWIKAAASVAGVANLVRTAELRPEMQAVFIRAFGGSLDEKQARSAVNWADKFPETPLLLMHGTADSKVSPLDSLELARKLYEYRKPFQLIMYDHASHALSECTDEWHWQTIKWFDRFLR
jgi:dipeptidyl aminopeptidase/acylaminoacyl peptidase